MYDVKITAADGTQLATDVYLPSGTGPWPTLLVRTGYDKSAPFVAPNVAVNDLGYALVVQDLRGHYASAGEIDLFAHEATDGADTVRWLRRQPWCDGRVGMLGASYLGAVQWHVARSAPEGLTAIHPTIAGGVFDGYGYHSPGVLQLDMFLAWTIGLYAAASLPVPEHPAIAAVAAANATATEASAELFRLMTKGDTVALPAALELVAQTSAARDSACEALWRCPLHEIAAVLGQTFPWLLEWLLHEPSAEYWNARDPLAELGSPAVASLQVGGWNDLFVRGTLRQYSAAVAKGGGPHRLIMHPFGHSGPASAGELSFDVALHPDPFVFGGAIATPEPTTSRRWFEEMLPVGRGDTSTPNDAPIRIYVMGRNEWRDEWEWPLARTSWRPLYLHSNGAARTRSGDGELRDQPEARGAVDSFSYDPSDPVPTAGGTLLGFGRQAGFRDQADVEERSDVLVYTSPSLEAALEVSGTPRVHLWFATDAVDTDITAKLVDVDPSGRALNVSDGVTRLRFHDPLANDEATGAREYVVELNPTSYVFAAGHRLRLQVSSSNFPLIDPNPNTGASLLLDPRTVVAHQRVWHDLERPSRIVLPTIPGETTQR